MKKLIVAIGFLVLAGAGCKNNELGVKASPSPSPTAAPTFNLEGVVVEASGSAAVSTSTVATPTTVTSPTRTPVKTTSPAATPGGTPSTAVTSSPARVPQATPTTKTTTTVSKGAPGSIALKVASFSATGGPCGFNGDDVVVISFTRNTSFKPDNVANDKTFPNNLQGDRLRITGTVDGPRGDDCLLVADTVEVTSQASPAPRGTTKASPTPTPTRKGATPSSSP